ncbi:hypothetical protein [Acidovorax sp. Leaf84]|uniref:hypothetical protein n=1 Tax=Acidovorax sp. Leaf84 TaxID=1736240 RepID=UPI000A46182F|nr:hypothetical protein [Acidovorax sp. Leaf84]
MTDLNNALARADEIRSIAESLFRVVDSVILKVGAESAVSKRGAVTEIFNKARRSLSFFDQESDKTDSYILQFYDEILDFFLQALEFFSLPSVSLDSDQLTDFSRLATSLRDELIRMPRTASRLIERASKLPSSTRALIMSGLEVDFNFSQTATARMRMDEIDRSISKLGESLENKVNQLSREASEQIAEFVALQRQKLDETDSALEAENLLLQHKREQLDKVLGTLAVEALSGGHLRYATEERKQADAFRWSAVGLMSAAAALAVYWANVADPSAITTSVLVTKALAAVVVTFFVAYLARQSAVHRSQQQRHMQTALDLAALDLYVAPLSREIQDEIKRSVAEKIFVPKEVHAVVDSGDYGLQSAIEKAVDKAIERISPAKRS